MNFWLKVFLECVFVCLVSFSAIRIWPKPDLTKWPTLLIAFFIALSFVVSVILGLISIGMMIWNI